jgi:hypothetical protein
MAIKEVLKVSDLSGAEGASADFGRLVVHAYPGVDGPRELDVLPSEVPDFEIPEGIVILEYTAPGSSARRTLVASRAEFDQLAPDMNMKEVITNARGKRGRPSRSGT